MILTKYLKQDGGLDILRNLRLKVSDPLNFNDPFECLPCLIGEVTKDDYAKKIRDPIYIKYLYDKYKDDFKWESLESFKEFLSKKDIEDMYKDYKRNEGKLENIIIEQKNKMRNIGGIICFSSLKKIKPTEEILLWSHYTNSHAGLRMSFDSKKLNLKSIGPVKVKYQEKRVNIDMRKIFFSPNSSAEAFKESLIVKSLGWSYGHEYRWFVGNIDCLDEDEERFIRIQPDSIVRIDCGVNSSEHFKKNILATLDNKNYSHIDYYDAVLSRSKYELEYIKRKV